MRSILKTAECHRHVSHYYRSDETTRHTKFIIINLDINMLSRGLSLGPEVAILSCGPSTCLGLCQWRDSRRSVGVETWARHRSDVAHNCIDQA